jgi:hypothetical protein
MVAATERAVCNASWVELRTGVVLSVVVMVEP